MTQQWPLPHTTPATSGQQLASTQEHTMAPNRTDHQLMLEDDNNMITSNHVYHDPSSSS